MKLIDGLKKKKKETGMLWSEISTITGLNIYTLSRIVNGRHEPIKAHEDILLKFINRKRK